MTHPSTTTTNVTPLFDLGDLATVTPLRISEAPEPEGRASIQDRFDSFHAENPWVFQALEELTRDLVARGHKRVGMKMLFEVVRWHHARATVGDTFRCNNDWTSRYARLLIAAHPEWEHVFETRRLRAA